MNSYWKLRLPQHNAQQLAHLAMTYSSILTANPGSYGFLSSATLTTEAFQLSLRTEMGRLRLTATSNTKPSTASYAWLQFGSLNYSDKRNLHLLCDLLSGSVGSLPAYCSRSGLSASQNFLILAGRLSSQDPGPSREGVSPVPSSDTNMKDPDAEHTDK